LALLEKKPNLELKNRDGDTALLRAVNFNLKISFFQFSNKIKNRDVQVSQLLVSMGAKLSTTDNAGDNGFLKFFFNFNVCFKLFIWHLELVLAVLLKFCWLTPQIQNCFIDLIN